MQKLTRLFYPSFVRLSFGFTLIELMVVIAIISILASFAAPKLTRHIAKAYLVNVHSIANQNQAAIEEYIVINAQFPNESELSNWLDETSNDNIKNITIVGNDDLTGSLKITLNALVGLDDGNYLLFSRDATSTWNCESSLSTDYLPAHCTSLTDTSE